MAENDENKKQTSENADDSKNNGGGNWYDSLSEEYRTNEKITQYKTADDFAKSYLGADALIGKKGIMKPEEGASQAEWDKYFDQVGRPTDKNAYELSIEGKQYFNEGDVIALKETFHKAGLTNKQAVEAFEKVNELFDLKAKAENELYKQSFTKAQSELVAKHGEEKYNEMSSTVRTFFENVVPKDVISEIDKVLTVDGSPLVNNPKFIESMYKVAAALKEDKSVFSGTVGLSQSDAKAKWEKAFDELSAMREGDPGRDSLKRRVQELAKFAFPE